MVRRSSSIVGSGSILEDFTLISYDEEEDTGRMLLCKKFDDGYVWQEQVAIPIPDLFYLFKAEGIDPTEMAGKMAFDFHKVKLEIERMMLGSPDEPIFEDTPVCWQCKAVRA